MGKIKDWIKRNGKALWWPVIAFSYSLLAFTLREIGSRYHIWSLKDNLFVLPFLPLHFLSQEIAEKLFLDNMLGIYVVYSISLTLIIGLVFYGLGFWYYKIKNRLLKLLFIVFWLIFYAYLTYVVYLGSRGHAC